MNQTIKSTLVFAIKLLVTIIPAYFVYTNITQTPGWDSGDLFQLFSQMDIWPLVVALVCLGVSNLTGCLQWKILLEKQDVHLSYGHLLKLYFVGLLTKQAKPFGFSMKCINPA